MTTITPILVLHDCCYHWDISVELRMIIGQYVLLKTELSHASSYEGHTNAVNILIVCESANRLFSRSYGKVQSKCGTLSRARASLLCRGIVKVS
jgi:hypothetical protein